uniref:RxLR effector protein n=1 Tax=Globodera pallida TaxID=36090 RepID=A0A183CFD4_GLOPA
MNAMLAQLFGIIFILTNFGAIVAHPVDKENEAEASTNNNVDKVTRNYVEALVTDEGHLNSMRSFAVEWAHNNALIFRTKKHPTKSDNIMIHPFTASKIDTMVSELGVYGVLVGNMLTKEVKHNVQQGHLLKTKLETANEGGISTGTAVHDSPILF